LSIRCPPRRLIETTIAKNITPAARAMGVTVDHVDAGAAVMQVAELQEPAARGPLAQALIDRSQAGRPEADAPGHSVDTRADGALEYTTHGPSAPLTNNLPERTQGKPASELR
jgi:hypothetical protein